MTMSPTRVCRKMELCKTPGYGWNPNRAELNPCVGKGSYTLDGHFILLFSMPRVLCFPCFIGQIHIVVLVLLFFFFLGVDIRIFRSFNYVIYLHFLVNLTFVL